MNTLHVNGLPPETTDQHLRDLFEQVGPVASAKVLKNKDGISTGAGIVEMLFAEDVDEILHTKDTLAIGGKRPHIWKPKRNLADVIRTEHTGIYLRQWKTTWYVFELQQGQLRWCWAFTSQSEAEQFRKQQIEGTSDFAL